MQRKFIIWGSSGHAMVLADILLQQQENILCLFDNNPAAQSVQPGVPLQGGHEAFLLWWTSLPQKDGVCATIAIGGSRGNDRLLIAERLSALGLLFPALVHTRAAVSPSAKLGDGNQVLANAVIAAGAVLGRQVIVNNSANVDHECELADGVHVAPGATLCGCVSVGRCAMIGAGATILPRIAIGANSIVGAGAVVTRDVPANSVVTGNPARIVNVTENLIGTKS